MLQLSQAMVVLELFLAMGLVPILVGGFPQLLQEFSICVFTEASEILYR
jgi:hypothetical protein